MTKAKRWLIVKMIAAALLAVVLAVLGYGASGYFAALGDAERLHQRAARLVAMHRGPNDLTARKLDQLIRVDDPAFWRHGGVDFVTLGSGMTTITQSLSKRLAFDHFEPGIPKIRQTGYAIGLERRLSKPEILTLFLDTIQFGRGPHGWMTGAFTASAELYGEPPAALSDREWLRLVAVGVAPRQFDLLRPDDKLDERVRRIERLLAGQCQPEGKRDVWLKGCV